MFRRPSPILTLIALSALSCSLAACQREDTDGLQRYIGSGGQGEPWSPPSPASRCEETIVPTTCLEGEAPGLCIDERTLSEVDLGECQLTDGLASLVRDASLRSGQGKAECLTELDLRVSVGMNVVEELGSLAGIDCLQKLEALSISIWTLDEPPVPLSLTAVGNLPRLKTLALTGPGFTDYTELSRLWLEEIYLNQTSLSNIDFLEGMNSITKATLSDSTLTDLSALTSWFRLRELWIGYTDIRSSDIFEGLTQLSVLTLTYLNELHELDGLLAATQLETVSLEGSAITSISGLRGATELTTLVLHPATGDPGPSLSSLDGLQEHHALESLQVPAGTITDLSPLAGLQGLHNLIVIDNEIEDFSVLSTLPLLTTLSLSGNRIQELPDLSQFRLSSLSLGRNQIRDISGLNGATQPFKASLSSNEISTLSDISACPIYELDLSFNQIVDASPLASATSLLRLYLEGNQVSDLNFLAKLPLTTLSLAWDPILDFTPISSFDSLYSLNLSGTGLSDLSFLESFTSLERFVAANNAISDLTPLVGVEIGFFDLHGNQIEELPADFSIPEARCEQSSLNDNPLSSSAMEQLEGNCWSGGRPVIWEGGACEHCPHVP